MIALPKAFDQPAIATNSAGNSVITWQADQNGGRDIFAQRLDKNGNFTGGVLQVSSAVSDGQANVAIAANGDFFGDRATDPQKIVAIRLTGKPRFDWWGHIGFRLRRIAPFASCRHAAGIRAVLRLRNPDE